MMSTSMAILAKTKDRFMFRFLFLFSNSLAGRRMVLPTQYKIVYARHRVL
jgi:hypothetical protein